ncbi:unnamed protein product [Peronospora effusa]|nr:unnamed protein product [Peronospora effusa]
MLSLRHHLHQVPAVFTIRSGSIFTLHHSTSLAISRVRLFQSLGLNNALVDRLSQLGLTTPTSIQCKAIPPILANKDVVVAAETGGGKTLAFLLPMVEQLRRNVLPISEMRLPAALVLTTSQELVRQLATVLHQVDPELAQLAVSLSSSRQNLGQSDKRACPLVFATPGALLRGTKPKDFAFTQMVVVDEADMLLGGGFEKDTKQILATIRNQSLLRSELNRCGDTDVKIRKFRDEDVAMERTQTIFSAISSSPYYGKRSVRHYIDYKFPSAVFAITKDFHRTLPNLTLRAHDLQGFMARSDFTDEKHARCELLYEILTSAGISDNDQMIASAGEKTLVFTNSIASADALFDFLQNNKSMTNCALFHKEVDRAQRQHLLKRLDSEAEADKDLVLICTDIAARGLDTTKVGHVVQFEFAGDVVSYLHRIGRTGRAGTAGTVTSIESLENDLVLDKIREAGTSTLQNAFSRKRSLRKKFKKSLSPSNSDY